MTKVFTASLSLLAAIGIGSAALAHPAPAQDAQDGPSTAYAALVSKMDKAYNMQFEVPALPEQTATQSVPAKPAG